MGGEIAISVLTGLGTNLIVGLSLIMLGEERLRPGYERRVAHANRLLEQPPIQLVKANEITAERAYSVRSAMAVEHRVDQDDLASIAEIRGLLIRRLASAAVSPAECRRMIACTDALTERRDRTVNGAPARRSADRRSERQKVRRSMWAFVGAAGMLGSSVAFQAQLWASNGLLTSGALFLSALALAWYGHRARPTATFSGQIRPSIEPEGAPVPSPDTEAPNTRSAGSRVGDDTIVVDEIDYEAILDKAASEAQADDVPMGTHHTLRP